MIVYVVSVFLLGVWSALRSINEARFWLTYLQSTGPDWIDCLRTDTAKANAVLNKVVVAKPSSAKAKIAAGKTPGPKK